MEKTRVTYYLSKNVISQMKELHAKTRIAASLLVEEALEKLLKEYKKEDN